MTDQEIRARLLKTAYNAKKTKTLLGIDPYRLADDWGEEKQKVVSIAKQLKKEGLLETETRARVVYANEFAITAYGIDEYEKRTDRVICKPFRPRLPARRGIKGTAGYECKLLVNTVEYLLTVSATENSLVQKGIDETDEKGYKALCEKVARESKESDIFNDIKDKWRENDRICFVLVQKICGNQVAVTYGPSWENPTGWTKPKVMGI